MYSSEFHLEKTCVVFATRQTPLYTYELHCCASSSQCVLNIPTTIAFKNRTLYTYNKKQN